jgi:iron complex outermembrane receptor protein
MLKLVRYGSAVAGLMLWIGLPRAAAAQQPPKSPPTLSELSLEELMKIRIEPVFGASRRLQPVTEAPASVTIVTADDIARHGYRTLAEILRGVRGFSTADDRNYSYVGVGGFAIPGDYNTRILLLVDGHRMNDNVFDQAQAGAELGLDPATFDRVEIIRGPASSLYGTNAFLAVVNIVTRSGANVNGVQLNVEGGALGTQSFRAAAGREIRPGVDVAIFAHLSESDGYRDLYYPAFDAPETRFGVASRLDGESVRQVFGRLRTGPVTVTGAFGVRHKAVPTAAFDTTFGDPRFRTRDGRFYLDGAFERAFSTTKVNLHAYVDRYRYDGTYPFASELFTDFADGVWTGAEARVTRQIASRHTLTAGAEWRHNLRQLQGGSYEIDTASSFRVNTTSGILASYIQDEFNVGDRLTFNAGLRLDKYPDFQRLAPRFAAIVRPSANEAIKYLYGNAFRAPNAYEQHYFHATGTLQPETINSHEVVWERYTGTWLRTSASAFVNRVDHLIALDSTASGDYFFLNRDHVHGSGLGLETEMRIGARARVVANYARQRAATEAGARLPNSPAHTGSMQVSVVGPRSADLALNVYAMSDRLALTGDNVRGFVVANVFFRVPVRRGFALTAGVQNLFDAAYSHPGSEEHRQVAIPQDGRLWRIGLDWSWRRK